MIYMGNLDNSFLSILDLKQGKSVFSLNADELKGLNIKNAYVAGHYLYLTKASDSPVIDILTGNVASKSWSFVPTAQLADGRALVLNARYGANAPSSANSIGRTGGYLARGQNGQPSTALVLTDCSGVKPIRVEDRENAPAADPRVTSPPVQK
jgi:hypothetical protein